MLHESCHIVADAGGWTCKRCRAHWRAAFPPETCADARSVGADQRRADRAAKGVLALLSIAAVLALVAGFWEPATRALWAATAGIAP